MLRPASKSRFFSGCLLQFEIDAGFVGFEDLPNLRQGVLSWLRYDVGATNCWGILGLLRKGGSRSSKNFVSLQTSKTKWYDSITYMHKGWPKSQNMPQSFEKLGKKSPNTKPRQRLRRFRRQCTSSLWCDLHGLPARHWSRSWALWTHRCSPRPLVLQLCCIGEWPKDVICLKQMAKMEAPQWEKKKKRANKQRTHQSSTCKLLPQPGTPTQNYSKLQTKLLQTIRKTGYQCAILTFWLSSFSMFFRDPFSWIPT